MGLMSAHDNNLMVDIKLLKITGLYQILSSNTVKLFGYNIFRFMTAIQIMIYLITVFVGILNVYYCTNDMFGMANNVMLIAAYLLASVKLYNIIKNADRLWNCVQSTSVIYLSYEYHDRRTLEIGRAKSKLFTMFFISLWLTVVIGWLFSPFLNKNHKMEEVFNNGTDYYRNNVLNLVYPVTDQFYNDNYVIFYILESTLAIFWVHSTLIFDVLTISMCVTLSYQLKTIASSYSSFGVKHNNYASTKLGNQKLLL